MVKRFLKIDGAVNTAAYDFAVARCIFARALKGL